MAKKKTKEKQAPFVGFIRTLIGCAIAIVLLVNVGTLDDLINNYDQPSGNKPPTTSNTIIDGELKVHFIDVGQGDSSLIEYKDIDILIDGGDNRTYKKLLKYMAKQDIDDIDLLIGTHMDADHIGGLDMVLAEYDVEKVIDSGTKKSTKTYKDYKNGVVSEKAEYSPDEDLTLTFADALKVSIIETGDNYKDENDNSVVTVISLGDMDFLFTGDMEKEAEEKSAYKLWDIDVYQVGHHGSRTSSSSNMLSIIKPEISVISCGKDNKYGHPHKEAIDRLNKIESTIYRTDQQGNITITTDGKTLDVKTNV